MVASPIKQPSAWVPLAMSAAALAIVLVHVAIFGAEREVDEGAAAHFWQVLMALQLPLVAFFAVKWVPRLPRRALSILVLQLAAALAAAAPVFFLGL
jgi:hypothetical protein